MKKIKNNSRIKELKKSNKYKNIRKALNEELKSRNESNAFLSDLVADYLNLWLIKELLKEDTEARGINIEYDNGGGQKGIKQNDSIQELVKINKQMLNILDKLEIKFKGRKKL